MLTLEQYRDPEMAKLYQNYLSGGPLAYIENVFQGLTEHKEEAGQIALDFYGPIFCFTAFMMELRIGKNY